jgi:hypothetical protein
MNMLPIYVQCFVCGRAVLAVRIDGKPDIPPKWQAVSAQGVAADELFACDNIVCQRRLMQSVMEEHTAAVLIVRSTVRVPVPPIAFLPLVVDLGGK